MFKLKDQPLVCSMQELEQIPQGKILINTINAFSYNNAVRDPLFAEALRNSNYLIPDGMSIVYACRFLKSSFTPKERIAGWDLFSFEMQRLNNTGGHVMFVGSSASVLHKIEEQTAKVYPKLTVTTYSPPYKDNFSTEDDADIIKAINTAKPDLLWIGLTAPKQEKWTYQHWQALDIECHCGTIGAVFDFFAGTKKRAPLFWQQHGIEWLYRLFKEPRRLWRRYIVGNIQFLYYICKER